MARALKDIVEARLTALGKNPFQAARDGGLNRAFVNDILIEKKTSVRAQDLDKLAQALEMSPITLLTEISGTAEHDDFSLVYREAKQQNAQLVIRGFVQAGVWQEHFDDNWGEAHMGEHPVLPEPDYDVGDQFLLEVRGDSMNASEPQPIREGALLKCVSFSAWRRPVETGGIVVIRRNRYAGGVAEFTVKRAHVFNDRVEFRPESTNPAYMPIVLPKPATDNGDETEIQVVAVVTEIIYRVRR